ncbi:MAG: hypothetical protein R3B40_13410 [Polyangiales bacterium]|nr:hypothetical protein [Myxococcales bacterium]MCB9659896.1 hypothetical protein [Sandaracinaceae bacterium]
MTSLAEQLLRDALRDVLGNAECQLDVTQGPYFGDPWSGATADTSVSTKGLRHPQTGRALSVTLDYTEHDLSGQTDRWSVTLEGFSATEAGRMRVLLSPFERVRNLNPNLRYRWTIDGKPGVTSRTGR